MSINQREHRLRAKATPEELKLLKLLTEDQRTSGRFLFQAHCCGYFPDFIFKPLRLIVELDGSVHCSARAKRMDARRTRELNLAGYRVIRFWNSELRDSAAVVEKIVIAMNDDNASPVNPRIIFR